MPRGWELQGSFQQRFTGEASGAAVLQRMTGAKQEWRTQDGTALGSVNLHHDAYGTRFDIRVEDGPAHSMCVAFGIERLVAESLRAWGESKDGWPSEVSGNGTLP